jgi:hypothetical protein
MGILSEKQIQSLSKSQILALPTSIIEYLVRINILTEEQIEYFRIESKPATPIQNFLDNRYFRIA